MSDNYWHKFSKERLRRRRLLQVTALGGAGLAAAALVGCSSEDNGSGSSVSEDGRLAPSQVLRMRFFDDPPGFDPATLFRTSTEHIAFNIYSGLTTYEPDGKVIADLAANWESPDPATFVFKLRPGVKWQKGFGDLSAEDVLYSYRRIMDPATASTYRNEFANVDSIAAPDNLTLTMKLKAPDVNFLHQVANYHQGQVVNRKAIESLGQDYAFKPVGTGPFILDSFVPSQQLTLVRNPDYFRGPATLERIVHPFIVDDETASIALQNGEVDLILGGYGTDETLARLEADSRLALNPQKGASVGVQIFNLNNQFMKDVRLRQAFAHAVDLATIEKTLNPRTGRVWYNLLPDWMVDAYTADVPKYTYDEAKAKSLISASGVSGVSLKWPTVRVTDEQQLIQSYLNRAGIKIEFVVVDTPTYNQMRNRAEFDTATRSLPAVNPDTILFSYLHPDNLAPKGLNGASYNNPKVTQALEGARAELNAEKRKSLYADVQKTALTDLPYWPKSHSTGFRPGYKWVSGVVINPLTNIDYYGVKLLAH
jgi:peptide/nickel transport system substrate-binding protein